MLEKSTTIKTESTLSKSTEILNKDANSKLVKHSNTVKNTEGLVKDDTTVSSDLEKHIS